MASNSNSKQVPPKFLIAVENSKLKDQLKDKDRKIERMKAEINEMRSLLSEARSYVPAQLNEKISKKII